jgi:Fe-S-cluster-containing dehydrogenase component
MDMEQLRQQPAGVVYPPGPPVYEKYEAVFNRRSASINRGPYLPQGKVALYNTTFEKAGFPPLPQWREPPESLSATPELTEKYPLILSDYHTSKNFSASWQRNVPHLREIQPDPVLHIHPEAASVRRIVGNDWVIVKSPHGWMKVKAEIYPGVKNASFSLACLHCVEPACAAACPEGAISKNEKDGLVLVDETLCNGCGSCADACAFKVPQFGEKGIMQKCDMCCNQQLGHASPPCIDTCPGEALAYIEVSQADKKAREEKLILLYHSI